MSEMQKSILEQAKEIPIGLCQCGCGQKTKIAIKNNARDGLKKGQPLRFIRTHAGKWLSKNPEYKAKMRDVSIASARRGTNHPCYNNGLVSPTKYSHRWFVMVRDGGAVPFSHAVMENMIKREVALNEVVHHINEDSTDDGRENLQLMARGEHARLHRLKEKDAGLHFGRNRYKMIQYYATCHPGHPHHAKGLCRSCYGRYHYKQR